MFTFNKARQLRGNLSMAVKATITSKHKGAMLFFRQSCFHKLDLKIELVSRRWLTGSIPAS